MQSILSYLMDEIELTQSNLMGDSIDLGKISSVRGKAVFKMDEET